MAAPTPTSRSTPTGIPLDDGHSTLITIGLDTDINFWEKEVTPPGAEGGEPVDTTTMHNVTWRTMRSQDLITLTPCQGVAAYDPVILTEILSVINAETTITLTFPDGSTWAFYGYLKSFTPNSMNQTTQPTAQYIIQPTNWDPSNSVEAGPAVASVAGT